MVMIGKRRKYRNKDHERYKELHNTIKKRIKEAGESWLAENCTEIETLERQNDIMLNIHKK